MKRIGCGIIALLFFWTALACAEPDSVSGQIVAADSGVAIAGASVRSSGDQAQSNEQGTFALQAGSSALIIRKAGYLPARVSSLFASKITLQPITPKALYLSYWGADSAELRRHLLDLLEETGMNALVIDLKSVRGDIAYRSNVPLATAVGAQRVRTLKDLPQLMTELKQRGIYTIARMAVFKDDKLARGRGDLAIYSDGRIWSDREKMAWSDPFQQDVRNYNLALAEEVAAFGFDEIQFDYIRFPEKSDIQLSQANTGENRVAAINTFLDQARERLAHYPVMISANIFGYICWKPNDTKIGQRLADLAGRVDYLSPMLYPSGFTYGIPGIDNPVAHNFEVIDRSLQQAIDNAGLEPQQLRPWLQAFRDYSFDRRSYKAEDIQDQIRASISKKSHGWMLWNAASRFSYAGLIPEPKVDVNLVGADSSAELRSDLDGEENQQQDLTF